MTIGKKIYTARKAKGYTQSELGNLCGTTKQTIQRYEAGIVTNIPLDRVDSIAKALDISPAYLMDWDKPEKAEAEAHYHAKILKDSDLMAMINEYYSLDPKRQEMVRDFVHDLFELWKIGHPEG